MAIHTVPKAFWWTIAAATIASVVAGMVLRWIDRDRNAGIR